MTDLLANAYPWIKSLHVISVISWMAGIFYLPRLYVYHAEQVQKRMPKADLLFQTMERRLLRAIMNPAMIATWVFGIMLALTPGILDWTAVWVWMKLAAVVGMTAFHMWLAAKRRGFEAGSNQITGKTFRIMNEVPTILMIVIVFAVIVKF